MDKLMLLSVETATRAGSLCVAHGERVLATRVGDAQVSQSNNLLVQVASVLDDAGVNLREVDLFAVATGPGSFTGLRIGLATVKSFAATLARGSVGIQTLHAIAHRARESRCTVAALPAGRGELFAQRFSVSTSGQVEPLDAPVHIDPKRLLDEAASTRNINWAGDGAHAYAEQIEARALAEGIPFRVLEGQSTESDSRDQWTLVISSEPLAVSVARLALARATAEPVGLPEDLKALYVRPSDAEMNERC